MFKPGDLIYNPRKGFFSILLILEDQKLLSYDMDFLVVHKVLAVIPNPLILNYTLGFEERHGWVLMDVDTFKI